MGLVLILGGMIAVFGEFASDDPGFREAPGRFEGRFLVVSDADMAATAYADGGLEPFEGAVDTLTLVDQGVVQASLPASNSVISWPQILDISPDGRFAAVTETRGPAPARLDAYDDVFTDFPEGSRLTLFAVGTRGLREIARRDGVGRNPQSVEYSADGRYLVLGSEAEGAELVIVPLTPDHGIAEVRTFALALPYREDDVEKRIRAIHASPDGRTIAVNVANRRIQFYRLDLDADGIPRGVRPSGTPTPDLGRRLSVGKWTPDGRFFIVTDTNWDEGTLYMLTQGPGALTVLRPPRNGAGDPPIVSRATVGRSPEGFGISADGRRIATINMERTYLPELPPLTIWPGRRRYSVSLLSLDPRSGALTETDRIHAAGILPEDVIFDDTGRNLAVAVYHRRTSPDRMRGFIDFFSIDDNGRLVAQGVTQPVMRGPHDLVRIP